MKIYAPTGAVGGWSTSPAPSIPVLAGRRIGVLDNGKPNARLLLERAASQLAARTGASVALVVGKSVAISDDACVNAATPAGEATIARLVEEVDLVITGSAV
jgi:hypothetical protein